MAIEKSSDQPDRSAEHEVKTFEELRAELLYHLPHFFRARQLIPVMYNRLTLIDGFSHREALAQIREIIDEVRKRYPDERGLSVRNLYRLLPADNPVVPHRIGLIKKPIQKGQKLADIIEVSEYARIDPDEPNVIKDRDRVIIIKDRWEYEKERFLQRLDQVFNESDPKFQDIWTEVAFINGRLSSLLEDSFPESRRMWTCYKDFKLHLKDIIREKEKISERIYDTGM